MGKGYREFKYEEHTADVKIVGYGNSLKKCFEALALGIMNIMYNIEKVENKKEIEKKLYSEDIISCLYDFLTEVLDIFYLENFAIGDVKIKNLRRVKKGKQRVWYLRFSVYGEEYNKEKHGAKKEVKAITYNEMSVEKIKKGLWKAQAVVDI